jgi:Delta14-sterol reductase
VPRSRTSYAGPLVLIVGLPLFVFYLWSCLTFFGGSFADPRAALSHIPAPTVTAVVLYGAWLVIQIGLHLIVPGPRRTGQPLPDGTRLTYRMNGWWCFWITPIVAVIAVRLGLPPTVAYDHLGPLLTTANVVAFIVAAALWIHGRGAHGVAGFYAGVSLNPRIGDVDLKLFCENRPGLILWVLLDCSFAAAQYERHGAVTTPMVLVVAFQLFYVIDSFFHEDAILTTWDMKHERFGWMLVWGNLVWVPFVYSIQAYFLVEHTHDLPAAAVAGIVLLNATGFVIFRGANLQKHRFRLDPHARVWGRRPEFIRTQTGALLLTSGWWGLARHLNYLGDLLMALAWCLPTGFRHPLTYVYFAFMLVLLVHREKRDHARCRATYGRDWDEYCRRVRWRMVPGVY